MHEVHATILGGPSTRDVQQVETGQQRRVPQAEGAQQGRREIEGRGPRGHRPWRDPREPQEQRHLEDLRMHSRWLNQIPRSPRASP